MNISYVPVNKVNKQNFIAFFVFFITAFSAQSYANKQAYITDELTIFMHAGPGTNYRILGTINAGDSIQITGDVADDYSEIIDDKQRTAWVETKYITRKAGLRFVVDDLKGKLANSSGYSSQLDGEVNSLKNNIDLINQEKDKLQIDFNQIQQQLKQTQSKLKGQDTQIKKEWFFNGALVLGFGLILGLILPRFFARRRNNMNNWG